MTSKFPSSFAPARAWRHLHATLRWLVLLMVQFSLAGTATAMGLLVEPAPTPCGIPAPALPAPPAAAQQRIPQSQAVPGKRDIRWAWLGSPTARYPHTALGSAVHAASLHALVIMPSGAPQEVVYRLPIRRVFEDRVPRLLDLDGDGRDEIIVVEADAFQGAALVVFGVRAAPQVAGTGTGTGTGSGSARAEPELIELARSPFAGSTFRWLNPVGAADFDGDGRLDLAAVITPHVGGTLTLYRYRPPRLEPYAQAMDVSNHRMGQVEQQLAVIVQQAGERPTVIVPDMALHALHALRWVAPGQWQELTEPKPLPARIERMMPLPGRACMLLADASWWRVTLTH